MKKYGGKIFTIMISVLIGILFASNYSIAYASEMKTNYVRIPEVVGNETIYLVAKIYSPNDGEIHPLIIINHGRSGIAEYRKNVSVNDYQSPAEWFVNNNFVVIVPVRRGYGKSEGEDAEGGLGYNPYQSGMEGAKDVKTVIEYMKKEKNVDKNKIVLVGHSVGGLVSMATASQNSKGVVGVVNFAGGWRRNLSNYDGDKELFEAFGKFGKTAKVPTLWIYALSDNFFPPYFSQGMYDSFTKNGGSAIFKSFVSSTGHSFFNKGLDSWKNDVQEYFKTIGME